MKRTAVVALACLAAVGTALVCEDRIRAQVVQSDNGQKGAERVVALDVREAEQASSGMWLVRVECAGSPMGLMVAFRAAGYVGGVSPLPGREAFVITVPLERKPRFLSEIVVPLTRAPHGPASALRVWYWPR